MNGIGKVQAEKTVDFLNAKVTDIKNLKTISGRLDAKEVKDIKNLKTIGEEALNTPIGILDAEKARANYLPKNLL